MLHPENPTDQQKELFLEGETLLIGYEIKRLTGVLSGDYWLVQNPKFQNKRGLVSAKLVIPMPEKVEDEIARAEKARQQRRDLEAKSDGKIPVNNRPEILDLQSDRSLAEAWDSLATAIAENEVLPEAERLPEPYLARAAIWSRLDRHSEALLDYFEALKYAQSGGRDIQELSSYFADIKNSLTSFRNTPAPPIGKETLYYQSASQNFDRGIVAYLEGRYAVGRDHFDNSIQLVPDNPSYWYCRAICHRCLGDMARAQHDALMGVLMERRLSPGTGASVNWKLSRVQGLDRSWIEDYRLGGKKSPTTSNRKTN